VEFTGSGCTGAIDKLARVFGISPLSLAIEDASKRPVVFIGPYEHHSNELIWRESPVDCVVIPDREDTGYINLDILQDQLLAYQDRPLKIGSFSAASNITGIRSDTRTITNTLHDHGDLACWDFAAAAPHVRIDMQGPDIDAAYISPHKFVGGLGTPGLLVARKSLFQNEVPTVPGGGTVDYVQPHSQTYVKDVEHREEGGTPAIIESIRAGLVLQLHSQVGPDWIEKTETEYLERVFNAWRKNPNIVVLGNPRATHRVSIVSFLIKANIMPCSKQSTAATTVRSNNNTHTRELYLHHNFVVAVLNDLFGIQSRGGCSCAGPYGHALLHIDQKHSDMIMNEMKHSGDAVKPGWTRVSFSYYFAPEMVNYIIDAVDLVAREGYKLLPWYHLNTTTSIWTHVNGNQQPMELWDFSKGIYEKPSVLIREQDLNATMKQAHEAFASLKHQRAPSFVKKGLPDVPDDLRWYLIQEEAQQRHSSLRPHKKSDHHRFNLKNAVMGRWHWAGSFQV
jgi:selenocysteine lyase/cysteine desulfurase